MAQITQRKIVEIPVGEKETVIKLEITLNVNMATGQVSIGTESVKSAEMKNVEFIIPKFEETTQLIEGFGEK